jgi:dienelactone hydrolase
VLAVEYPGYGIYKGAPSEKNVLLDAEAAYNYLLNEMHCNEEDIFVAGRSIGSGPATWLASKRNPGMLILVSPFTSIRAVVKNNFGSTAQYFIKERFNNLENIPAVKCPVFILHGKKDTLIPEVQAMALYGKLFIEGNKVLICGLDAVKGKKRIYIAEEMDHGAFDFIEDLIVPLEKYMWDLTESVHSEEVLSLEAVLQGFEVTTQ